MNKKEILRLLDYLSFILIISFFYHNNINLVFIGIVISLYSINRNLVNQKLGFINTKSIKIQSETHNTSITKTTKEIEVDIYESNYVLVEKVEELGFIPSRNRNKGDITA